MKFFRRVHDFLIDRERLDLELNWITKLWYIVLLVSSSIFVINDFPDIVTESILKQIDGRVLIFILWLVLLILPLFESFEGFGVRVKRSRADQKQLSEDIVNMTNKLIDNKVKPIDMQEIEDMFKRAEK